MTHKRAKLSIGIVPTSSLIKLASDKRSMVHKDQVKIRIRIRSDESSDEMTTDE